MSAQRWLAHEDFLAAHPYYAAVLARLDALEDADVQRIALGRAEQRIYLLVSTSTTMDAETEKALLMHAVHHVVLGHVSHPKFASPAHPDLMQLAMEISANEHVPYVLPCGPVWKDFERIGMRARESTMSRYELLCEARRSGEIGDVTAEPTCDPDPKCGGGIGDSGRDDAALEHARDLVGDAIQSILVPPPGRAGHLCGNNAGQALEHLSFGSRTTRVKLDWRTALSGFLASVRAPVHTYARPSRRFPDRAFEVPGRTWAPQKGIRPRIVCAIDTSASISKDELEEIALHLANVGAFAEVTVVECDARIQRIYRFDGRLDSVRGRGGTDLRPPFDRSILERYGPDGIVYFTDGLGPAPVRDPGVKTLWVLTRDGSFRCPWGARAYV